jgi:hypothetical protein
MSRMSYLIVRKALSLIVGASIWLIIISLTRGNQQILAWPAALLSALLTWPDPLAAQSFAHKASESHLPGRGHVWAHATLVLVLFTIANGLVGLKVGSKPTGRGGEILQRMAAAEAMAEHGDICGALSAFEAIAIPTNMPIQKARQEHNCGVLLIQLRRPNEAVRHLLLSLKYDPTNVQSAYLLASLAADNGKHLEAEAMIEMVLSVDPRFEPARRLQQKLRSSSK